MLLLFHTAQTHCCCDINSLDLVCVRFVTEATALWFLEQQLGRPGHAVASRLIDYCDLLHALTFAADNGPMLTH